MELSWLDQVITSFNRMFPPGTFLNQLWAIKALLAVIFVGLVCGAVGSLVVGNRMAFFSDALAHIAIAGIALGLMTGLLLGFTRTSDYYRHGIAAVMVAVGIVVGLAIAFVRERTGLTSDTIIGVFFAGAIGFGAIILHPLAQLSYFRVENFLFGDPISASSADVIILGLLVLCTLGLLLKTYNALIFTSFNPSLARSRNIPMRLYNYLFIALLALIVNLSLKIVGALLINALLVVPAATAALLCRNIRQMFWTSVLLSVSVGVGGLVLCFHVPIYVQGHETRLGDAGVIVVLSVVLFFGAMLVAPWLKGQPQAAGAAVKDIGNPPAPSVQ